MRTKYSSNSELSHIWANDPDSGVSKSANSMSCFNGKLYSYSTVIAQIYGDHRDGTVIHNTASYSNTTSKHQHLARDASRHYPNQIFLDIPRRGLDNLVFKQVDFDELIVKPNLEKGSQLLLKASRSKKYSGMYNAQALDIFDNVEKYARFFGLSCIMPNTDALLETITQHEKESKAIEKVRKAQRIKEQAEALENWRAGLDVRNYFEVTALRIKDDEIQTTRGARIPVDHAVKFWGLIKSWHEKGVSYVKDHHSIHLGNYTVNSFKDDTLIVGCHSIPYSEIESIASQLNLQGA